jgi:class 3 adenylate cyclase/tetratricopeptide (TPR) repeat protein
MKCPRCQHENEASAKFCEECASPLARTCGNCGRPLSPTAKFCPGCAYPTGVAVATPARERFSSPESYIPKHLAEKILTSKAALEGERKRVTVLFADLKGSMELLADRDPEEARKILDPVLERMMEAVHRYEGTVNQVMGDGIMALFGAPVAHEDHAVRACYAALRMQDSVHRYAGGMFQRYGVPVEIRVGLNSGEVVVRTIGSDLHMDYTAVGQTTHLAARMEQMARPGTILLAPDTLALAEGFVQVTSRGPIPVKGLPAPIEIFELAGASPVRSRLHVAASRGLTRFVGRDAELDLLRQSFARTGMGIGQVVAIVGEPGVGKSRLVWEFTHSHRSQGWLVLETAAVSYGKAATYLPVIELFRGYFGIEPRDDDRKMRQKVTGKLQSLDGALEPTLPVFLWLLDVPIEDAEWMNLDPSQRRRQTLDALKRLLLRESQVQPVLVVVEDLHWIDSETQAWLDLLVESLPAARLLLIVNYRPEYRHGWGNKTYYQQVRLDALPIANSEELLKGLLGTGRGLADLRQLLIDRTQGNPFFLEESVRTLVETRALTGERGAYRLEGPIHRLQLPATTQAILAARIDRLAHEDKRLLQAAAVVGKDVPFPLLEAIAEEPAERLREGLDCLQTAEFLYEARLFPEIEYAFKHALTHEVAYGGLLHERRRELHALIVTAIETLHGDRLDEHVELLANHAARAGIVVKAIRYLREAGMKAVARSANREAVDFLERALELLSELPQTTETLTNILDIRIALGPPLMAVHGAPSPLAEASYLAALKLLDCLDDPLRRFLGLWGLWFVRFTRGDYPTAVQAGERLLETAKNGEDAGQLLEAHHTLWPPLMAMGELKRALSHMERGLALYDRERHASYVTLYGGHDPGACCRYHLALTQWVLGYPDRAVTMMYEASSLAETLRHALTSTITLWFVAFVRFQRGERPSAVVAATRALSIVQGHAIATWAEPITVLLHAAAGAPVDVDTLNALQRQMAATHIPSWRHVIVGCLLAGLYGDASAPERGLEVLASLRDASHTHYYGSEVYRLDGELRRQLSPSAMEDAERSFRLAIDLARRRESKSLELRATTSLARLWRDHGQREAARHVLAEIYGWFTEGFDTADLRDARIVLDELSAGSR